MSEVISCTTLTFDVSMKSLKVLDKKLQYLADFAEFSVNINSVIGGGIRNVVFQNSTFEGTDNGIRIKSARDRGGLVENVVYRNLTMKNVGVAITINLFYFDKVA